MARNGHQRALNQHNKYFFAYFTSGTALTCPLEDSHRGIIWCARIKQQSKDLCTILYLPKSFPIWARLPNWKKNFLDSTRGCDHTRGLQDWRGIPASSEGSVGKCQRHRPHSSPDACAPGAQYHPSVPSIKRGLYQYALETLFICILQGWAKEMVLSWLKFLPSCSQPHPATPGRCLAKQSLFLHKSVLQKKINKISVCSFHI